MYHRYPDLLKVVRQAIYPPEILAESSGTSRKKSYNNFEIPPPPEPILSSQSLHSPVSVLQSSAEAEISLLLKRGQVQSTQPTKVVLSQE